MTNLKLLPPPPPQKELVLSAATLGECMERMHLNGWSVELKANIIGGWWCDIRRMMPKAWNEMDKAGQADPRWKWTGHAHGCATPLDAFRAACKAAFGMRDQFPYQWPEAKPVPPPELTLL